MGAGDGGFPVVVIVVAVFLSLLNLSGTRTRDGALALFVGEDDAVLAEIGEKFRRERDYARADT